MNDEHDEVRQTMKSMGGSMGARVSVGRLAAIAVAAGTIAASVTPAVLAGAASRKVVVSVQSMGSKGRVLTSNGKALYFLVAPGTCDRSCLAIWPALTLPAHVKGATAGHGVQKSKLGSTTDMAGAKQVTYNGQPVYWFKHDKKGRVTGNITDQWGKWTAVVIGKSSSGPSSTSNSGGSNAGSGGVSF